MAQLLGSVLRGGLDMIFFFDKGLELEGSEACSGQSSINQFVCCLTCLCGHEKDGTSTIVFSTTAGAFPLHLGSEALSPSGNQRRKATIDVWCVFVLTCGISCPPQHGTRMLLRYGVRSFQSASSAAGCLQ